MKNIFNIVKTDMRICRRSMIIMIISIIAAGFLSLFLFTPLIISIFVIVSNSVVSSVFSVEKKSNMDFYYSIVPVKRWEYTLGRGITLLISIIIPTVISLLFLYFGSRFDLCRIESIRIISDIIGGYSYIIVAAFVMIALIGGANLIFVSFLNNVDSREIIEVLLLLAEGVLSAAVLFIINKLFLGLKSSEFYNLIMESLAEHKNISSVIFILIGLFFLSLSLFLSSRPKKEKLN